MLNVRQYVVPRTSFSQDAKVGNIFLAKIHGKDLFSAKIHEKETGDVVEGRNLKRRFSA